MIILRTVLLKILRANFPSRCQTRSCCVHGNAKDIEEECDAPDKLKDKLLCPQADPPSTCDNKVTIIGCGNVGIACAFSILAQKISNNICIVSQKSDEKKLLGEMMDLQHGSVFLDNATINAGTDYSISSGSRVGIIAAGLQKLKDGNRLGLAKDNAAIIKNIVPQFTKTSPCSVLIMVSNPVDILTYFAWRSSGFQKSRVIGSGTTLDSARFQFYLSQRLNVTPSSCQGMIIGEHGFSAVPVWSGVNVSGVRLAEIDPRIGVEEEPENFNEILDKVIKAGSNVVKAKGYTCWAIALSTAAIAKAVINNDNSILPVSTCVKGFYGIDKEVFLSIPCVINANGAQAVVRQKLTDLEVEKLQASAEVLYKVQSGIPV